MMPILRLALSAPPADKIDLPSVLPDFLVVFLQGWVFTAASRHVLRKDRHHTHPPSGLS